MRFVKALAAVVFAAALLVYMGSIPGAGGAQADSAKNAAVVAPTVTTSSQDSDVQEQSLSELLGMPQAAPGARAMLSSNPPPFTQDKMVNASTYIEEGSTYDLNGHTLTVNGNLDIYGTLNMHGGKLIIKRNTADKASDPPSGNLVLENNGVLIMQNAKDSVDVARALVANGGDETGKLTAGSVKVSGDFLQFNDYSDYSWNESDSQTVTLSGADKLVVFQSPGGSAIRNLTIAPGTTFTTADRDITITLNYVGSDAKLNWLDKTYHTTGGTFLSLSKTLTADYSLAAVPNLYYSGNQGGWKLTTSGSLIVPAGMTQSFTGDVSAANVTVYGTLTVATAAKTVASTGAFGVYGTLNMTGGAIATKDFDAYGTCSLSGGTLTVSGTFHQHTGADVPGSSGSFRAVAGNSVIFDGQNSSVLFDSPGYSYFYSVSLAPGSAFAPGAVISVKRSLAADYTAPVPSLYFTGNLNGHRMAAVNLTIPTGLALDVGGGRLDVSGDLDVKGHLAMHGHSGAVVVGGVFTAEGEDSTGDLTDGFLALRGDFVQKDGASAKSFNPAGPHVTMLVGTAGQQVRFENPGDSGFGQLVNCNPAVTFATSYTSLASADSSIALAGIAVTGGAAPFVFDKDTAAYDLTVPEGVTSVSFACTMQKPGQIVDTLIDGVPLALDTHDGNNTIPVDATRTTVVTLVAMSSAGEPYEAAGDPFSTSYTVTLHPVNSKLASAGFAYTMDKPLNDTDMDYAVTVPVKDDSFTLTPVLANPNATLSVDGAEKSGSSYMGSIGLGQSVEVYVAVTPYASVSPTRTYRFTFRRQTLIDGLAYTDNDDNKTSVPLADGTVDYTVDVPASTYSVVVAPAGGDGCFSITPADPVVLAPKAGCSATATMTLTDVSGAYSKTYTLTVQRAPLLTGITVTGDGFGGNALKPDFTDAVGSYTAIVPVNSSSVTVSAGTAPGCTGLTVGGQASPYSPAIAAGDEQKIDITASAGAADGQKATYTVTVSKPLMIGLNATTAAGTVAVPFTPGTPISITIPSTQSSVTLAPVGNDNGAGLVSFSVGGITGTAFAVYPAQGETRTVTIQANYTDGITPVQKDYSIEITREKSNNADLSTLGQNAGWLSPSFSAAATAYTLLLPDSVSSVTLSPSLADANSMYKIDTAADNTAKAYSLSLNGTIVAKIVVTAARLNTKTYTVTIRRVPVLSSLTASPVYSGYPSLSPGGSDRLTVSYGLALPATVKLEVKKGSKWYTLLTRAEAAPGVKTFTWDGKVSGKFLGTGSYSLRVTPYYGGKAGAAIIKTVKVLPKPSVAITKVSPSTYTANGSNKLTVGVKWTRICDVKVEVVNSAGAVVRTLYAAACQAPATRTLTWDSKNTAGALVPAGKYRIKVTCGGAAARYKAFTLKR